MRWPAATFTGVARRVNGGVLRAGEPEGDLVAPGVVLPAAPDGSGKPSTRVVGRPLGMNRLGFWVATDPASSTPETFAAPSAKTLTPPPITRATASRTPTPTSS